MSLVLITFRLSMLAVVHVLTSPRHDCLERTSSDILSGGADICSCRSSANEWCMSQ